MIEFTVTFIPYMMLVLLLVDAAWAIFAKSALMYAVHFGCRTGITVTENQIDGEDTTDPLPACAAGLTQLTPIVKNCVEANSFGLLPNANYIQVHYYAQCSTSSTGMCDVSTTGGGDSPGNVMQVGVYNYPLPNLVARIYLIAAGSVGLTVDKSPAVLGAVSADVIEASNSTPPIGPAP